MRESHAMPTTKRRVDREGPDFYPTPAWATRALLDNQEFPGYVWEPACGDGAMAEVLKERYPKNRVFASDLYDRGYGETGTDFLDERVTLLRAMRFTDYYRQVMARGKPYPPWNIITNPPYHSAQAFLRKALEVTRPPDEGIDDEMLFGKVALLLRLAFLEGAGRYEGIFREHPPSEVLVFSNRITFYPAGAERKGSGTTPYAWFVWDHREYCGQPRISWINVVAGGRMGGGVKG